jgi:outer membrane receptor for ferrienterochelin and colicin
VKLLQLLIAFISINSAAAVAEVIEEITVIASSPIEMEKVDHVSGNIHVISGEDLREKRSMSLAEHLAGHNPSIILNGATSNPLQPDVQLRGFVGSSLLGLPQGLAVYLDGVRLNEPFGDTVNWALIPEEALETVYVIPGSNPLKLLKLSR